MFQKAYCGVPGKGLIPGAKSGFVSCARSKCFRHILWQVGSAQPVRFGAAFGFSGRAGTGSQMNLPITRLSGQTNSIEVQRRKSFMVPRRLSFSGRPGCGQHHQLSYLPDTTLVNRCIKKVQNFGIDDFGFFDWHRMRCAGNDRFVTAWNGFGELIRVLALN
jgi:hypothetical protein